MDSLEKRKEVAVRFDYLEYEIEQHENTRDVSVYYKDQEVMHIGLSETMTKEELIETVSYLMNLTLEESADVNNYLG